MRPIKRTDRVAEVQWRRSKQFADAGEFGFPMAVRKEAVMADALKAIGQNMEQKLTEPSQLL